MTYISAELRRQVRARAGTRCEYCLVHETDGFWTYHVDHIYAEKHGGETAEGNLCLSCGECNLYKGTDLCSLDPVTGEIVSLFHPRHDLWSDHFEFDKGEIRARTSQGRITMRLLRLNDEERIVERRRLWQLGHYLSGDHS